MNYLDLELEYDLIEQKNTDIISSNDIQNDILNLVKLSENIYLYTLTPEQIFKNPDAFNEFNCLARNIFNYVDGHCEYLKLMVGLIKCMRHKNGLNKRLLSYCLLDILSEYNADLANELFLTFVTSIGCWKDLKYFYSFSCEIDKEYTSSVVEYSIQLANKQLKIDLLGESLSNVSKWIPREKSKYKKLYDRLVLNYFNDHDYFKYINTLEQKNKAMNKAKMEYRKKLSKLNKQLDTVQIKQCSKQWQKINPKSQTRCTLELQMNAFLNLSRNSNRIRHESADRIICAQNFIDINTNTNETNTNTNEINTNTNEINTNTNEINTFNELFNLITKYSHL